MIAAILPLIPLLAPLIPRIAEWIGGDDAEDVARQVTGVVTAVAGSTDPAMVAAAMADPARGAEMALGLAKIAADREAAREAAQTARMQAALADTANARQQTVALADRGHAMAWMPAIVTGGLFAVFIWTLHHLFAGRISPESRELALLVVGAVVSSFGAAVQYWLGSSSGSVAKDTRMGAILTASAAAADAAPRPFAGDGR